MRIDLACSLGILALIAGAGAAYGVQVSRAGAQRSRSAIRRCARDAIDHFSDAARPSVDDDAVFNSCSACCSCTV